MFFSRAHGEVVGMSMCERVQFVWLGGQHTLCVVCWDCKRNALFALPFVFDRRCVWPIDEVIFDRVRFASQPRRRNLCCFASPSKETQFALFFRNSAG